MPVGFTDSAMGVQSRRRGSVAAFYVVEPATSAEVKWLRKHLRALGLVQQQQLLQLQPSQMGTSLTHVAARALQHQQQRTGAGVGVGGAGTGVVPASGFATLTRAFGRHLLGLPLRPRPRSRPASHSPGPGPSAASSMKASLPTATAMAAIQQQQKLSQQQLLSLATQKRDAQRQTPAPQARPVYNPAAGVYENENEAPRAAGTAVGATSNASPNHVRPKVTFRVRVNDSELFVYSVKCNKYCTVIRGSACFLTTFTRIRFYRTFVLY